eukprot:m.32689 g.32689  ORF g.32689 m.32689 type:complete len:327 (+) comp7077_c0_seq1:884-1864(+)
MRRAGGGGDGPAESTGKQNAQAGRGGASPLALADEWCEIEGEDIAARAQTSGTPVSASSGNSKSGWGVWIGLLLGVTDPERVPDGWKVAAYFYSDAKGKDRFARLLAYYGKFRSHFDREVDPVSAAFWGKFSKELGTHRKTLKLFKWVADYDKAARLIRGGPGAMPTRWTLESVAAVFYVPYEFFNNIAWLRSVGLIHPRGPLRGQASKLAARARMVAVLALLAKAVLDLRHEYAQHTGNSARRLDSGVADDSGRSEWFDPTWVAVVWSFIKALGDLGVYGQKSGLVRLLTGVELSAGVVGAAGILGSVAGSVPIVVKMSNRARAT